MSTTDIKLSKYACQQLYQFMVGGVVDVERVYQESALNHSYESSSIQTSLHTDQSEDTPVFKPLEKFIIQLWFHEYQYEPYDGEVYQHTLNAIVQVQLLISIHQTFPLPGEK